MTLDEVILGDFFLDSVSPLTAFNYDIVPAEKLFTASFTTGQQYIFSTGLEVAGEVTKTLRTVAEPDPVWLLGFGLLGLALINRSKVRNRESYCPSSFLSDTFLKRHRVECSKKP